MAGFTLAELANYETTATKQVSDDTPPPAAKAPDHQTPPAAESSPAADAVPAQDATVDSSVSDTSDTDVAPTPTSTAEEEPTSEPEPKGSGARERIEDLVAERNALKKYAEYLQQQMAAKPAEPPPAPAAEQPPVVTTEGAPTLESVGFDTDKWTQAMQAWTAKQIEKGVKAAITNVQAEQQEVAARQAFESRLEAFKAKTPDLAVVLGNPDLPRLDTEAAKLVVASDIGPQILYHLGKNPEKAVRIARRSPAQQAAAIGRLEAELSATAASPTQKKPNITKAPAPPTPTPAGGAARIDPMAMSMADFVKHEREQALQKRLARNRR
jgi:hypothetical protein